MHKFIAEITVLIASLIMKITCSKVLYILYPITYTQATLLGSARRDWTRDFIFNQNHQFKSLNVKSVNFCIYDNIMSTIPACVCVCVCVCICTYRRMQIMSFWVIRLGVGFLICFHSHSFSKLQPWFKLSVILIINCF